MKIINREKTHFLQPDTSGVYSVKYGTLAEVHAMIDSILDAPTSKKVVGNAPAVIPAYKEYVRIEAM